MPDEFKKPLDRKDLDDFRKSIRESHKEFLDKCFPPVDPIIFSSPGCSISEIAAGEPYMTTSRNSGLNSKPCVHDPDWENIFVVSDGGEWYIHVPCKLCGEEGVIGTNRLKREITWED